MIDGMTLEKCCGCGACKQICPKGAIAMHPGEGGFLYPKVDKTACVRCGLCQRVCPVLTHKAARDQCETAYAAKAKDAAVRLASSSGGMFTLLARAVLRKGGVVFGAAFADDFSVRHVSVQKEADIPLLVGSKYVQSDTGNTFTETRSCLAAGRPVLYVGTACQIAGLRAFLQKDEPNLYTVDILCHGVPAPALWQRHLSELKEKYDSEITSVNFRCKDIGWNDYTIRADFANGARYDVDFRSETYQQLFLYDIALRKNCHTCCFKALDRPSDLTLGDAWGIGKILPEMDDNRGTSAILVHSEKGAALLRMIQDEITLSPVDADTLVPKAAFSRRCPPPHPNRSKFMRALDSGADISSLWYYLRHDLPLWARARDKVRRTLRIKK